MEIFPHFTDKQEICLNLIQVNLNFRINLGILWGKSESALSVSSLSFGSGRTNLINISVDTTKFLDTAIKNKSGLEFRGFIVENAASFRGLKFLLHD